MDDSTYVGGNGPIHARIAIVGESPASDEMLTKLAFTGPSGRLLNELLKDAGINRSQCWVTNCCKYFVPPNVGEQKIPFQVRARNAGIDLVKEYNDLQIELNNINPNVVIGLGGTALYAITGKSPITDYRGSILSAFGRKCVSTFHPAHLLHQKGEISGYWQRPIIVFDLKRALKQSLTPELNRPSRYLHVARSSADVYDFILKYKDYTHPAIDIEAKDCIPVCIGIAFIPNEGITIPLWNSSGISSIPTTDLASIWILLSDLLINNDIIGQNFKYDQDKIARLGFKIRSLFSDTMLKAFAINPELPKNLAFNTSIYTEEPFYKNEGMYEGSIDDLFIGCARDSCVTKEIDLAMDSDLDELQMRPYYENFIMHLHDSYLRTENIGFRIDSQARERLLEKYIKWQEANAFELWNLCGDKINTGSPKQVSSLLFDNLKLPRRKGTGEEELTALLAQHGNKNPVHKRIIELILEDRRVKKTISTYLLAMADFDGRMKTTYFLALETGRTSTGQQDPPIRPTVEVHNLSGKKINKVMGTAFQTMTKHGDVGNDLRSMYIADEGEVFINADSSQAEARVVFLLANDEVNLRLLDTNDLHAITASWFFGGTEENYSKKKLGYESPSRFIGKTLRHAGHLGAKKKTAAITVNTDARKYKIDINITEAFAENALKIFHAKNPNIQGVFHKGIQSSLSNGRKLRAPVPFGVDAEFGPVRIFYERFGEELFRQAYSYIPQRTVSDNTKAAKLRIEEKLQGIRIILESHDSLLLSVKINDIGEVGKVVKEEMERPIDFSNCSLSRRKLIIPCELEEGINYKDFKRLKI
ncbi:MAG TPA: DNA polymerase [Nitrosopumilaceae archaeon]|jgi:uracil-DNA glycosylase family 4|nr:DNA polymerase [Nitrosopumilaceae archaeon]